MTEKNQQNQTKNLLKSLNAASGTPPINRADNTLPQAAALKVRFKASSIPLQTDFADLIDIASIGRQAVGGAEGQTGPADGLTLSETGRLELKANPVKGIYADKDGLAIRVGDGLKVDGRGVNVKGGNGIAVDSNGVSVKLAMGAQTNGGGGQGKDGNTSGGGGGLILNADGLSVDAGDGIQINPRGVSIKLASNSGLSADESNGLKIVPEQMFKKGMIMMFSGTGIPAGWALCDGANGTPDLRDRFIVGKGQHFATTGGSSSCNTTPSVAEGKITVNDTALTVDQIPTHHHNIVLNSFYYEVGKHKLDVHRVGRDPDSSKTIDRSEYTGSGNGHNHMATLTSTPHSHTVTVIPPYYALAFIMKL